MSTIEIAPQKQKEYNDHNVRKQDHGDAASERSLSHYRDYRMDPFSERGAKIKDKELLSDALTDDGSVSGDLFRLTPDELEDVADAILEDNPDEYQLPVLLQASQDILDRITNDEDEAEVTKLLNQYHALEADRNALIDAQEYADMETEAELVSKIQALDARAEQIEEKVMDILQYQDTFATEAELGLKSKSDIRKEMARRVTLDVEYDDDDNGDSDYSIPVRIRSRL
jgi:hypothetical protein